VFCPFLWRKYAQKDGNLLRSPYVAGDGHSAGHPRPRDRRPRPAADAGHLAKRTESSGTNSIRYVQFLPRYYRNLCPAGRDYPRAGGSGLPGPAGHDYPARRVTTTPIRRVTTTPIRWVTTTPIGCHDVRRGTVASPSSQPDRRTAHTHAITSAALRIRCSSPSIWWSFDGPLNPQSTHRAKPYGRISFRPQTEYRAIPSDGNSAAICAIPRSIFLGA